jgi:hypothetical protein
MVINIKTKIWLSICSIVFIFSFFTLYYFPHQQEKLMVNNIVCQPKGELDIQCYYWQDKNKINVPIELLISKPNFNKIVMDKVAKLKNEGYKILNTNIPNI